MSNTRIGMIECALCLKMVPRRAAHNGRPAVRAKVCYSCNLKIVIPARLELMQ